jgi:hypothetical protein
MSSKRAGIKRRRQHSAELKARVGWLDYAVVFLSFSTLLFAQFSAHPWKLSSEVTLKEMRSYAAALSFDELLHQLAFGETQRGAPPQLIKSPLVIGWGQNDRVCFPNQAKQAIKPFPDAKLHWGSPIAAISHNGISLGRRPRLILASTRGPWQLKTRARPALPSTRWRPEWRVSHRRKLSSLMALPPAIRGPFCQRIL